MPPPITKSKLPKKAEKDLMDDSLLDDSSAGQSRSMDRSSSERRLTRSKTSDGSGYSHSMRNLKAGERPRRAKSGTGERYIRKGISKRNVTTQDNIRGMDASDTVGPGARTGGAASAAMDSMSRSVNRATTRRNPTTAGTMDQMGSSFRASFKPDLLDDSSASQEHHLTSIATAPHSTNMGEFEMSFSNNLSSFAAYTQAQQETKALQQQAAAANTPSTTRGPSSFMPSLLRQSTGDDKALGSTMLAERGKWNQVDQSVNLMSTSATGGGAPQPRRSGGRKGSKRGSVMDIFFGKNERVSLSKSSMVDIGLGPDPTANSRRRQTVMLNKSGKDFQSGGGGRVRELVTKCGSVVCSLAFLAVIAIVGILCITIPFLINAVNQPTPIAASDNVAAPAPTMKPSMPPVAPVVPETTKAPKVEVEKEATEAVVASTTEQEESSSLSSASQELSDELKGIILAHSVTSSEDFDNEESTASKALLWMATNDPISAEDIDIMEVVERYILALLHFSTHPNASPTDSAPLAEEQTQLRTGSGISNRLLQVHPKPWLSAYSICHWEGVRCHPIEKQVVSLDMTSQGLSGTIPPEMKGLEYIQELFLDNNNIHGTIATELGELTTLTVLSLDNCDLHGEIPSELGEMEALKRLHLSNNELTGTVPASLSQLEYLEIIHVQNNKLTGFDPDFCESKSDYRLNYVSADCLSEMECNCCERCY